MDCREYIVADPTVMTGRPVIKGTRLSVEHVLDLLASGWSSEQIVTEYPGVAAEAVRACMTYARAVVGDQRVSSS